MNIKCFAALNLIVAGFLLLVPFVLHLNSSSESSSLTQVGMQLGGDRWLAAGASMLFLSAGLALFFLPLVKKPFIPRPVPRV